MGFWVFLQRQSNSEESALSRLHILADLLGNKSLGLLLVTGVFLSSFLWNFRVRLRVFEKRSKFYLSSKFFYLLYTETWQVKIVPIELPNPEETQIWEGENESVRSRQHLLLQLLLVIAAFILQSQWMVW